MCSWSTRGKINASEQGNVIHPFGQVQHLNSDLHYVKAHVSLDHLLLKHIYVLLFSD